MRIHIGDDVDEVELLALQQFFGVVVNSGHTEVARQRFGLAARAIIKRDALGAFQFAPGRQLVARPESCAEIAKRRFFIVVPWFVFVDAKLFSLVVLLRVRRWCVRLLCTPLQSSFFKQIDAKLIVAYASRACCRL
jgi:hypothetical protein